MRQQRKEAVSEGKASDPKKFENEKEGRLEREGMTGLLMPLPREIPRDGATKEAGMAFKAGNSSRMAVKRGRAGRCNVRKLAGGRKKDSSS